MNINEMTVAEPDEIFNEYCNQKNIRFEGDRGVENLNTIAKHIGYRENGFKYGSSLEVFLSDNPGAQEAIFDWIRENMNEEWAESLSGELVLDDYDEKT